MNGAMNLQGALAVLLVSVHLLTLQLVPNQRGRFLLSFRVSSLSNRGFDLSKQILVSSYLILPHHNLSP